MDIFFLILIINIIGLLITKPKLNTLSCGIFAWAGKSLKDFDKAKFDMQGLYNDSRGGDSCGVTTDGEIYYGAAAGMKHYRDFLVEKNYLPPTKFPVVIGHTRKSSMGVVNENNAHPFGFGHNEEFDSYAFLGVHNGTIYNHETFAKEFEVETSITKTNDFGNKEFVRGKIDSEILLECIYKDKSFKVLSDYNGGAALLFTDTTNSNILYAFHGASATYVGGKVEEERPLYYYRKGKNNLYISSLYESLVAIGGVLEETIFEFEHNVVYEIKNGDIDNAIKTPISRATVLQKKTTSYYGNSNTHRSYNDIYGYDDDEFDSSKYNNYNKNKKSKKEREVLKNINNIYDDVENKTLPSPIIFHKLRYRRNGHLINGLYTYIPNYGIIPLNVEPQGLKNKLMELIGATFNTDSGMFNTTTLIPKTGSNFITPFPVSKTLTPPVLYMYEGVLLETESDYIACNTVKFTDFESLSYCSKHPLIDVTYKTRAIDNQNITFRGELYDGNFSPLGSNKIYYIEEGKLLKIVNIKDVVEDNKKLPDVIQLPISSRSIITEQNDDKLMCKLETEFSKHIDKPIQNFNDEESEENDKEELDIVDEVVASLYSDVQEVNQQLELFSENKAVQNIIEINNDYLKCLDEISPTISK